MDIGFDPTYPIRASRRYAWPEASAHRWALAGVILLGFLLRLLFLGDPIRWDESANAVYYTSRDLLQAVGGSGGNPNHILHSFLSWFSVRLLGWSVYSFRAPVLLAGVLAVWTVYATVRWSLGREREAILAAALAAVSPLWVLYSVNGRGYMLQAVLVPLLYVLVVRGLRGDLGSRQSRSCAMWAAALTALGALAVRSMLVFFVPLAVLALLTWLASARTGRGRPVGGFVGTWLGAVGALTALAFLPIALVRGWSGVVGMASRWAAPAPRILRGTAASWLELLGEELFRGHGREAFVVAAILMAVGLAGSMKSRREPAAYALLLLACSFPVAMMAHVGLWVRILVPAGFVLFLLWARGAGIVVDALAGSSDGRRVWATGAVGALAVLLPLSTLGGTPTRPEFVPVDHRHVRAGAAQLFSLGDLSRSALVVPSTWDDAPVAFYALAAGMEIPYLVGMDRVESERDPCELRELVVVSEVAGASVPGGSPLFARATGEALLRTRLAEFDVEVTRWALAPCPTRRPPPP